MWEVGAEEDYKSRHHSLHQKENKNSLGVRLQQKAYLVLHCSANAIVKSFKRNATLVGERGAFSKAVEADHNTAGTPKTTERPP